MMRLVYSPFAQSAWAATLSGLAPVTASQTWEWGEARSRTSRWTAERGLLTDLDGRVLGAVQTLVRRLPLSAGGLAYVNRGPVWSSAENGAGDRISEALELLRRHWVVDQGMVLRVAPPMRVPRGEKGPAFDGFAASGPGWSSMEISLEQSPEELRRGMKQKWRNCLYKAERSGARVRIASDSQTLERFLPAYEENLRSHGLEKTASPNFLRAVQPLLPPERKLLVLEAVDDADTTLAWAVLARYADTAEYIAGVTLLAGRPVNAGQLLIWSALSKARELGLKRFDLGGVDPEVRESGVAHFKAGAGGTAYRLTPEVESRPRGPVAGLVSWAVVRQRRAHDLRSSESNKLARPARRQAR